MTPEGADVRPDETASKVPLQQGPVEVLAADPGPVPLTPVLADGVEPAVPVEEVEQPMALAQEITAEVLAAAQQIALRLLRFFGDMDGRQLTGPKESDQLGGIAAIGLDPLTATASTPGGSPRIPPRTS